MVENGMRLQSLLVGRLDVLGEMLRAKNRETRTRETKIWIGLELKKFPLAWRFRDEWMQSFRGRRAGTGQKTRMMTWRQYWSRMWLDELLKRR